MNKFPQDWKDCYFIFYKVNPDKTISSVGTVKPIVQGSKKNGTELEFYGVKAGKYGMYVPGDAEQWGIFQNNNGNWSMCFSGELPEPYTKSLIKLPDGRMAFLRRGKVNMSISISLTQDTKILNYYRKAQIRTIS